MPLLSVWNRRSLKGTSRALMWAGVVGSISLVLMGCGSSGPEPISATVSVLAEGGPLHGSNGMIIGPDGLIYVASVSSSVIAAINPESGTVVEEYGPDDGVNGEYSSKGSTTVIEGQSQQLATLGHHVLSLTVKDVQEKK